MTVVIWVLVVVAIECARRAVIHIQSEAVLSAVSRGHPARAEAAGSSSDAGAWSFGSFRRLPARTRTRLLSVGIGIVSGLVGLQVVGPLGLAAGTVGGALAPRAWERKRRDDRSRRLERQLAELAESTAMAVRSGLSISQALEFAAEESTPPMSDVLDRFIQEQRLGVPFEEALHRMGDEVGTSDARLLTLVVRIHARSGGNLGGALDDVAATIRHRIRVRRELRALSAQGRISGSILGALPIAFFLVLAATSRQELAPVYRSPAGIAMISAGLVMEALAFMWIRRLLRIEA
jgi:tight adherence protein B